MNSIEVNETNISTWHLFFENAYKLLNIYKDILNSYVLDFFTEDLWHKINPRWIHIIEAFSPDELSQFLKKDSEIKQKSVWPLSLLSFRASCFCFSLPREPNNDSSSLLQFLNSSIKNHENQIGVSEDMFLSAFTNLSLITDKLRQPQIQWEDASTELSRDAGQHQLLQHIFRRHLKPKKQHEITRLAHLAFLAFKYKKVDVMVDVGSGQGHLARLMAYGYKIPIICLDSQKAFLDGARKFDLQLESFIKKKKNFKENLPAGPHHIAFNFDSNYSLPHLCKLLEDAPKAAKSLINDSSSTFGMLGLHCCGDLGPSLLKAFCSIPSCALLIQIGCCYMKISTDSESNKNCSFGYPMSKFVSNLRESELSYTARELSCHAIEAYSERLKSGAENLKVHSYRAILEDLIVRKVPSLKHEGLRSVNKAHLLSFRRYAEVALSKLNGIVSFSNEELESELVQAKLDQWMQVVIFYSLRLMLAPIVETLILLDRAIFLYEAGIHPTLVPLFDPSLSPRSYALLALKQT